MEQSNIKYVFSLALVFLVGALIVFFAAYLTPLKHFNFIEPTINDISAAEFSKHFDENPENYIFMDVRSKLAYDSLHAQGSIHIPLHGLYQERKFLPKKGQTIVLICDAGSASGVGYSYLEHYGFRNLLRIEGGIQEWQAEGLPIIEG